MKSVLILMLLSGSGHTSMTTVHGLPDERACESSGRAWASQMRRLYNSFEPRWVCLLPADGYKDDTPRAEREWRNPRSRW